jgi:error-prone DNA polymerase
VKPTNCGARWAPGSGPAHQPIEQNRFTHAGQRLLEEFARNLFGQIEGFGSYGFPESHAASFALSGLCLVLDQMPSSRGIPGRPLSTASRWVSTDRAQLVTDARRHGVEVLPVDVNQSDCDSTLECPKADGMLAVRLG